VIFTRVLSPEGKFSGVGKSTSFSILAIWCFAIMTVVSVLILVVSAAIKASRFVLGILSNMKDILKYESGC